MSERRTPAARGTIVQRVRAGLLVAASWLACRLPEGPLIAAAEWAGSLAYRLSPERAARARRNLRRVTRYLAEAGLADARTRAAAADPRALERLVRSAFRHHARYYLEILRAPGLEPSIFEERIEVENPDGVEDAFARHPAIVFVSGHLGPIELPGFYLATRFHKQFIAPMETVDDPALQGWFIRTRSAFGVRIIGLREARRELSAALKRGEHVGLVADRDISGGGIEVPFFGAPAPIPVGPAFLAIDAGVPIFMAGVWRTGRGTYRGRLDEVPVATEGTRRQRVEATIAAEALAFERIIARAPDQWTAVFLPIWPDLEAEAAGDAPGTGKDATPGSNGRTASASPPEVAA